MDTGGVRYIVHMKALLVFVAWSTPGAEFDMIGLLKLSTASKLKTVPELIDNK